MATEFVSDEIVADVVVVGGGIVGVCTAWYLAERGADVALVERGEIASGCSYGNAGWVFPSHSTPIPRPGVLRVSLQWLSDRSSPLYIRPRLEPALLRWMWRFLRSCNEAQMRRGFRTRRELGLRSHALYEKLAAVPGLDFGYEQQGLLLACESAATLEEANAELRLLEEHGGAGRRLDSEELRALVPALGDGVVGGVLYPNDAHIDPALFVTGLARAAEGRGVRVTTGNEVLRIDSEGSRVVGVTTTQGRIRCEQLVLAGGSWSPSLLRPLGLRLPVQPAKGYSVTVRRPEGFGSLPIMLADARVGVTPLGDRLRFAGTLELAGLDLRVELHRVDAILDGVRRHLPGLGRLERLETWRGLRPLSPDDLPIIGRPSRFGNLVVATGHGMSGICQGPVTGELVAQLVSGEAPGLDLSALSPDRF